MPDEEAPEPSGSADSPAPSGASGAAETPSRAAQELERVGAQFLVPRNLNAEHQRRLNEAIVKQEEAKADQAGDDRELRRWIAIGTSIAVAVQLVIADVAFVVYGATNSWVIPGSTMSAWLGATVVQVIALAVVVVRSLFPPKDK